MDIPKRKIPLCAPRKSGLTRLQLVLMGKGRYQALRPMSRNEADRWADAHGRKSGASS